jgi:hypothetical protein
MEHWILVLAIGAPYGERKNQEEDFFFPQVCPTFNFSELDISYKFIERI